jgi:hypothetical protein
VQALNDRVWAHPDIALSLAQSMTPPLSRKLRPSVDFGPDVVGYEKYLRAIKSFILTRTALLAGFQGHEKGHLNIR